MKKSIIYYIILLVIGLILFILGCFEIVDSLSNYYSENHVEYTFNGHLYLPENVKYA